MKSTSLLVSGLLFISFANSQEGPKSEDGQKSAQSLFDQALLTKGTLTIKEFISFGSVGKIKGDIAILTNVGSGTKTFALRVSTPYYRSQYDNGETSAFFDAKEVESAINAIDFMITKSQETVPSGTYAEITYRGNGKPNFGFWVDGNDKKIFFEVDYKSTQYFEISQLGKLREFFVTARAQITNLGGKTK